MLSAARNLFLNPIVRITVGLLSLTVAVLLALDVFLGVFPSPDEGALRLRQRLAETFATQITLTLSQSGVKNSAKLADELARREPSLVSLGLRNEAGELLYASAAHASTWERRSKSEMNRSYFVVPIMSGSGAIQRQWGQVELAFMPLGSAFLNSLLNWSVLKMSALFSLIGGLAFYFYLKRTMQHLDPQQAVPERVQNAFDSITDAVIVLDTHGRIVMSNLGFNALLPSGESGTGADPSKFTWLSQDPPDAELPPWVECMRSGRVVANRSYRAHGNEEKIHARRLIVSCSPLFNANRQLRGCMASFHDVTELDAANEQLHLTMMALAESKDALEEKNQELQRLATVDPLSGAVNRRAFSPLFEALFVNAKQRGTALSFIIVDVDKFKSINDSYGHATGDKVIHSVAAILLRLTRDSTLVCRYGGEEFCVALPATDVAGAVAAAERIRSTIQAELGPSLQLPGRQVITVSLGISSIDLGAVNPAEMFDQADRALYSSKRMGRNRSTVYSTGMEAAAG